MLLVAGVLASELYVPTAPTLFVRDAPDASALVIGRLVDASSFEVVAHHAGPGCADWGALTPRGYACLEHAVPTEAPPVDLPVAIPYAPPEPADAEQVLSTGTWPAREPVSLVPFVYGRRWRQWPGRTWTDLAAWDAGAPPRGRLIGGRPSRFVARVETARGPVLVRPDGKVAPESEVWLYPVSRFRGRDALADPVPPGLTVAWGRGDDAVPLRAAADPSAEVVASCRRAPSSSSAPGRPAGGRSPTGSGRARQPGFLRARCGSGSRRHDPMGWPTTRCGSTCTSTRPRSPCCAATRRCGSPSSPPARRAGTARPRAPTA